MKRRNFIKTALAAAVMASPVAALIAKTANTRHRKSGLVYFEEYGNYQGNTIPKEYVDKVSPTPVGYIELFTGKDIPEGWAVCDGANGTPDLRAQITYGKSIHAPKSEKPYIVMQYIMKIK